MHRSDMLTRKLILELETGGNIRFEDEQNGQEWVKECEDLLKLFSKRSFFGKMSNLEALNIHRISKLHNRYARQRFEEKNRQKLDYQMFLCYQGGVDDLFNAIEQSNSNPEIMTDKDSVLKNYLEIKDTDTIMQAIIVRVAFEKIIETTNESFLNFENDSGADALSYTVDSKLGALKYFSRKNVYVPEYFIEYSISSEIDPQNTALENIVMDVAYSNRLAKAEMPHIVNELSYNMKESSV